MDVEKLDQRVTDDLFRHMGRRAFYTPKSGQLFNCLAVIFRGTDLHPQGFESQVLDAKTVIHLQVSAVGRPKQGDKISVAGQHFTVDQIIEDDGVVVQVAVR